MQQNEWQTWKFLNWLAEELNIKEQPISFLHNLRIIKTEFEL